MSATLTPTSVNELVEAVHSAPRVLAVGAGTKPRLSAVDAVKISTSRLRGITEYDPGEFTFTALAGTPVREIAVALAERGQYLPFDPMLLGVPLTRPSATLSPIGGEGRVRGQRPTESSDTHLHEGSTLGGTVAAGLSGPGRFRFGGVRDFILGVRFVDGEGRLLRMGGKVVKNAAGFDLPKFFVGSLGRFGVLVEMTFKVFPRPASTLTLKLAVKDAEAAALVMTEAANARWEADALDYLPEASSVFLRLAGPAAALEEMAREILARWPGEKLSAEEAENLWTQLREFYWAHQPHSPPHPAFGHPLHHRGRGQGEGADSDKGAVVKVPLTPAVVPMFIKSVCSLNGTRVHVSAGGNVAFVSLASASDAAVLDAGLRELGLSGVTLRGDAPLWFGVRPRPQIAAAVKLALDPQNRFPSLDD